MYPNDWRERVSLKERWDLVGFGVAAVDDVFTTGKFIPNEKHKLISARRLGGGQTETALVAAARLGCSCYYGGNLGRDERSDFVRGVLSREGIGYPEGVRHPEASPTYAVVIVDQESGERSILWSDDAVVPPVIDESDIEVIRGARCILTDQNFPDCQLAIARTAREAGIPVVGDYERLEGEIGKQLDAVTDHIIVPLVMARRNWGMTDPEDLVARMMTATGRKLACVTDGVNGCWFATHEAPYTIRRHPAFSMPQVVDTNGCGDIFHGAYAASLIQEFPLEECIRRAAATAALKTRQSGGQTGAPTLVELERFLQAVR
ncbi:MAG: carbohydrate kinase family protein [Planctomycetes bacterium]|nr:carbohydrate kinase family protein [Planctomycetota bacterium]